MRYIGGKSQLLGYIENVIRDNAIGNETVLCDLFSGTGAVARHFKPKYEIHSNDSLHFSYVLQKATIENNSKPSYPGLANIGIADPLKFLEETHLTGKEQIPFFIADNYSPGEDCERMYVSRRNAMRIDFIRNTVEAWCRSGLIDEAEYYYLLAALIEGVPYVSNIAGTYGAYLKHWDKRTYREFEMSRLDVIDNGRSNRSYNADANKLIREIDGDILYIDPPYNSRQYAPNYHLLETISRYDFPEVRGVTGMRRYDDVKSAYCNKSEVLDAFEDLISNARFSTIITSYSTEGLMSTEQIESVLTRHCATGSYKRFDIPYRKYQSKATSKAKELKEHLFYARKRLPSTGYFPMPVLSASERILNYQVTRLKYQKSPLNYIGGKFKILPQIMPLFPRQVGTFVDLFAGGCNVGINAVAERVICNDLNTKIIEMFKAFQSIDTASIVRHIEGRIAEYSLSKDNEQGFLDFRKYYNRTGDPLDLYTLTCYSFNYQFRFNSNLEYNNPFGRSRSQFSENMRNNLLSFLEKIKSSDISFTSKDFLEYDISGLSHDDMVYCDPPYLITTGSYNDGNRGFKDWNKGQEAALYDLLDRLHKQHVRFALSNVLLHKGARNEILIEWCKKYVVTAIDSDYSNSSYNTQRGGSLEVLITNY